MSRTRPGTRFQPRALCILLHVQPTLFRTPFVLYLTRRRKYGRYYQGTLSLFCGKKLSLPQLQNVEFMNNPARFSDVYRFRVTFECIAPLEDGKDCIISSLDRELMSRILDLEWRLIFVSCPGDEALDQELDDCLVGPVPQGINSFEFEGSAPDPSRIPEDDVLGVAALILTGSYRDQEFVRVGYYQNTEYDNDEMKETPPSKIMFNRLVRDISAKPRVTRFHIKW